MRVVSVSVAGDNQIVFSGSGLAAAANDVLTVSFGGISATSVVADSAGTQVFATFQYGVPYTTQAERPVLSFNKTSQGTILFPENTLTLSHTKVVGGGSSIDCSFAGGCLLSVQTQGVSSRLVSDPESNFITVCGEKCQVSETSSPTSTKCTLPQMPTSYANTNFGIVQESEDLRSDRFFGSNANYLKAFDDNNGEGPGDFTSNCHIGMEFNQGFVGILSQVKFFLKKVNLATFTNNLEFQGSNDGASWSNIFTTDGNVHEGWNYKKFDEPASRPTYRVYRFFGKVTGSCDIKEIKLAGVKAIQDTQSTKTCPVGLVLANNAQNLNQQVTYVGSMTASLNSIQPRYGPVTGGTSVTFSGQHFSSNTGDYEIKIDGFTCTVTAATSTSVTCTTAKRPGLHETSLSIFIRGRGYVATRGKVFKYVSVWSDATTWGGEYAPVDGESIHVPKGMNLYVDIQNSPRLNALIVEGGLIFEPSQDRSHHRTFDAHYIFVRKGYMEVGTEEFPYTSKITFTMHGNVASPYIPIYGNKVIGVR